MFFLLFKRQKIVWSLLLVEYYTHLACSILLILKEAHNPKYVGSLGPYLVVFLVAIEIVAPLLSPMIEEFVVHKKVNFLGFLNSNFALIFSPVISIPVIVQFA